MSDRINEIKSRLDAATPGPWHNVYPFIVANEYMQGGICTVEIGQKPDADLIAHAPADIAWLIEQYEWMSKERDKVVDWLLESSGNRVDVEEVLFKFGIIQGTSKDGTHWMGTCSCNAQWREECYCGYDEWMLDEDE